MHGKIIICQQCGISFLFLDSEQKKFLKHGFSEPKRCEHCRKNKQKFADSKGGKDLRNKKKARLTEEFDYYHDY